MYPEELSIFLEALPEYFEHLKDNPHSLIARIYGVFKVKMEAISPVNLILMANTIQVSSSQNIQNVFDLKGSIVNRFVKITNATKNTSTLKDLNFQEIKHLYQSKKLDFLRFKKEDINRAKEQIRKDVELFRRFRLMDYSLLFAVEINYDSKDASSEGKSDKPPMFFEYLETEPNDKKLEFIRQQM